MMKNLGRFAAKNAPTLLKGARFLAEKSGNKTIQSLANSEMLDKAASMASERFGGRGSASKSQAKRQAKTAVAKLIKLYGTEGTRRILRAYVKTKGRGVVGKVLGGLLSTIFPF